MIRPYSPIEVETHLRIELKQGDPVSGFVQWADKGLVGVTFDEPIDVLALLNAASEQPKPRMPRIEIDCTASLRYNEFVFRADVANISQGGICVNSPVDLEPDSDVVVTIAGLRPTAGIVKWQEGELFGIGFNRVIINIMTFPPAAAAQRTAKAGDRLKQSFVCNRDCLAEFPKQAMLGRGAAF